MSLRVEEKYDERSRSHARGARSDVFRKAFIEKMAIEDDDDLQEDQGEGLDGQSGRSRVRVHRSLLAAGCKVRSRVGYGSLPLPQLSFLDTMFLLPPSRTTSALPPQREQGFPDRDDKWHLKPRINLVTYRATSAQAGRELPRPYAA